MNLDEEIKKWSEKLDSKVKDIKRDKYSTVLEFENGEVIPIYNGDIFETDLNLPICSFCKLPSDDKNNDPLFTIDDKVYICKNCTVLAFETFVKHGVPIDLNLGTAFPDIADKIDQLGRAIQDFGPDIDNVAKHAISQDTE